MPRSRNPWSGALFALPLGFGIDPTIHVAANTTYTNPVGTHVVTDDITNPSMLTGFVLDAPAFSESDNS